jgi:hypothetical protein
MTGAEGVRMHTGTKYRYQTIKIIITDFCFPAIPMRERRER